MDSLSICPPCTNEGRRRTLGERDVPLSCISGTDAKITLADWPRASVNASGTAAAQRADRWVSDQYAVGAELWPPNSLRGGEREHVHAASTPRPRRSRGDCVWRNGQTFLVKTWPHPSSASWWVAKLQLSVNHLTCLNQS